MKRADRRQEEEVERQHRQERHRIAVLSRGERRGAEHDQQKRQRRRRRADIGQRAKRRRDRADGARLLSTMRTSCATRRRNIMRGLQILTSTDRDRAPREQLGEIIADYLTL